MKAPGPGQLLFGFVRHWSRRASAGDASVAGRGRLVLVSEAVSALMNRRKPATVNAVAEEIGIDQSGASRLIRNAVEAGYLTLEATPSDRRRRHASVTPLGRALLREAHAWQEQVFEELTAGWDQRRRDDLQSAMADLIARSYEIDN